MPDSLAPMIIERRPPPSRALRQQFWGPADDIETAGREAASAFRLIWGVMEEVSSLACEAKKAGDSRLVLELENLYLLTNSADDRVKTMRESGGKIREASRIFQDDYALSSITDVELLGLRRELQAAEDALNKDDAPEEGPVVDAYHAAHQRFLEATVRTPAGVLLKLERLAEIGEMEKEPELATNMIVLNLIRDLRAGLGVNRQVS